MNQIALKELKATPDFWRRVRQGQSFVVMVDGTPIAVVSPYSQAQPEKTGILAPGSPAMANVPTIKTS